MSKRLHIFDMDGTLLKGSTASIEISKQANTLEQVHALESEFSSGSMCTTSFARGLRKYWSVLEPDMVMAAYHGSPWLLNMEQVFTDINKSCEKSILITMSPNFFADLLKEQGINDVYASNFPQIPFREEIRPEGILSPAKKVDIVKKEIQKLGLSRDDCIAYGDSSSDIPLFDFLPKTVAINATESLRKKASVCYDGNDLYEAYLLSGKIQP